MGCDPLTQPMWSVAWWELVQAPADGSRPAVPPPSSGGDVRVSVRLSGDPLLAARALTEGTMRVAGAGGMAAFLGYFLISGGVVMIAAAIIAVLSPRRRERGSRHRERYRAPESSWV